MSGRRKVTTTMYLEPEQAEALKALSERSKVPMAEFVREGIAAVLEGKTPLAQQHRDPQAERLAALGEELEAP